MIDINDVEKMAKTIVAALPDNIKAMKVDLEQLVLQILQNICTKMDLVSNEEFTAQAKVLANTQEKLEVLSKKIQELENNIRGA